MIEIVKIQPDHTELLLNYLSALGPETKKYFGPHGYDRDAIFVFHSTPNHCGYIAYHTVENRIVGYAVVYAGYIAHDCSRLSGYGLLLNHATDASFAPSVADDWQGKGIGKLLFAYMLSDLEAKGINRILLWGGVQNDNERALRYYKKLGFKALGSFEYYGWNTDMAYQILRG